MPSETEYVVPSQRWDGTWKSDPASRAAFDALKPGERVTVIKYAPNGSEAARYPAVVIETSAPAPWIEVVARWTMGRSVSAGLVIETGDTLREFFSAEHPYNAFAVISPEGRLRGWYGNVTYPAFVLPAEDPVALVWHDLYLDAIVLPGGTVNLLDDDELAEAGMADADPDLAVAVERARRDLIDWILAFTF